MGKTKNYAFITVLDTTYENAVSKVNAGTSAPAQASG